MTDLVRGDSIFPYIKNILLKDLFFKKHQLFSNMRVYQNETDHPIVSCRGRVRSRNTKQTCFRAANLAPYAQKRQHYPHFEFNVCKVCTYASDYTYGGIRPHVYTYRGYTYIRMNLHVYMSHCVRLRHILYRVWLICLPLDKRFFMLYICSSSNLKKCLMNVFATLKTVFFGSKFLSAPVPSDGTPRRDFVSALNGLMPLCRTIPVCTWQWISAKAGWLGGGLDSAYRRECAGGRLPLHCVRWRRSEGVDKSQVLPAENGKGNLSESRNEAPGCPAVLIEKRRKKPHNRVMNIARRYWKD